MSVKLFILGRPGSGKSYAARRFEEVVRQEKYEPVRFNDYTVLYDMFREDTNYERFQPTPQGGFDVLEESAFDDALNELEKRVRKHIYTIKGNIFYLIEFARRDYNSTLRMFQPDFFQNAYILFLETDIGTSSQRINMRSITPQTEDDHPLSEEALRKYYSDQIKPDASLKSLGLDGKFDIIDNNGSLDAFIEQLEQYVQNLLKRISLDAEK